jgi:hypothetical protein
MGVREAINQGKSGVVAGVILICFAVAIAVYYLRPTPHANGELSFYTDDDGQTFFEDSAAKFPPFDHDGKTANQAMVFENTKGLRYVGFQRRYRPEIKQKLEKQYADDVAQNHPEYIYSQAAAFDISGVEIKLRGKSKWIPQGQDLNPDVTAPDGDIYVKPVDP